MDSDRDGLIAEDDIGGVDIDRNFPHLWPEFNPSAGQFQLSEPESQSLVKFVLEHPRIIGALVIGRWDNLVKTPDSKARDVTGKTPIALDSGDAATWEEMGRKWRELSGQARSTECDPSGSFALWLYAHRDLSPSLRYKPYKLLVDLSLCLEFAAVEARLDLRDELADHSQAG